VSLGVPIGGDMLQLHFWVPLLECIKSTLFGWKSKNLCSGGGDLGKMPGLVGILFAWLRRLEAWG